MAWTALFLYGDCNRCTKILEALPFKLINFVP